MLSPRDDFIPLEASLHASYVPIVQKFQSDVQSGVFTGNKDLSPSLHVARGAVKALRDIVGRVRQEAALSEVLGILRTVGKALASTEPYGALIANVVRRVLWIVRDEHQRFLLEVSDDEAEAGRQTPRKSPLLAPSTPQHGALDPKRMSSPPSTYLTPQALVDPMGETRWGDIKSEILSCIAEYLDELSVTKAALCKQADKHVREGETILTYGHSKTMESFLAAAAIKRKFKVIVVESCPGTPGATMAAALRAHGVDVTVVPISSTFAVMDEVGKVILGTQLVLANGGSLAQAGSQIIALCARQHNVPVLVIAATEKFSPYYAVDRICSAVVKCADNSEHVWDNAGDPEKVVAVGSLQADAVERIEIFHVVTDYVHPDLVTLYITNEDSFGPSYAYKLIAEWYSPEDFDV